MSPVLAEVERNIRIAVVPTDKTENGGIIPPFSIFQYHRQYNELYNPEFQDPIRNLFQ